MRKYYLFFLILTVLVGLVVVEVFMMVGNPIQIRGEQLDGIRIKAFLQIRSDVEAYYLNYKRLPKYLYYAFSDNLNLMNDPETGKNYTYLAVSPSRYELCATFSTNTNVPLKSGQNIYTRPPVHTAGSDCIFYTIPDYILQSTNTYVVPTVEPTPPLVISTSDDRIQSITSSSGLQKGDIKDKNGVIIGKANFPDGFFSNDQKEWGAVSLKPSYGNFLRMEIVFKTPQKIKSITNVFTNCSISNCFHWDASGMGVDAISGTPLVNSEYVGENISSTKQTSSIGPFKKLYVEVNQDYHVFAVLYWKKLQIEYAQ